MDPVTFFSAIPIITSTPCPVNLNFGLKSEGTD